MRHLKKNIILPVALTVCLLLALLVGGTFFMRYLKAQIASERTTQLLEITAQVRANLNNALDSHWNYLTAAVNFLERQTFDTPDSAAGTIGDLERLLETEHTAPC